jgi:hypothetical protein
LRDTPGNNEDLDVPKNIKRLSTLLFFLLAIHSGASTISAARTAHNPDPRSGFVASWDGAKIHYLEAGKISATAPHPQASILLVPGFTMPDAVERIDLTKMADVLKFEKQARPRAEEIPAALREFIDTVVVPALVKEYLAETESPNLLVLGDNGVAHSPAIEFSLCEVLG